MTGSTRIATPRTIEIGLARARAGGGPTLIECKTYRSYTSLGPRGNPDLAAHGEEAPRGDLHDPVAYLGERIVEQGAAGPEALRQIEAEVETALDEAVAFALASPLPNPEDALTDVFAP